MRLIDRLTNYKKCDLVIPIQCNLLSSENELNVLRRIKISKMRRPRSRWNYNGLVKKKNRMVECNFPRFVMEMTSLARTWATIFVRRPFCKWKANACKVHSYIFNVVNESTKIRIGRLRSHGVCDYLGVCLYFDFISSQILQSCEGLSLILIMVFASLDENK